MSRAARVFLIALLACLSGSAAAQLYPLFGPSTGILKGSTGTQQTSPAAASDVLALFSGTCNSTMLLRGDATCTQTLNTATFSPTAGVTITGPSGSNALTITGSSNSYSEQITGANFTGESYGLLVHAGSNTSDDSFSVVSSNGTAYLKVVGDGGTVLGSATGGDKGLGTLNASAVYVNGVAIGSAIAVVAYGNFTAACAATGPTPKNMSCLSHPGAGVFNISVSGFTQTPSCVVNAAGPGFAQVAYGSSSSSAVQIATYNTSSANADEPFSLICMQ